ncbi:MAG: hypothetical protein N4A47_03860 [Clostridia bacterium]|jgi:hypothetical protein|nr:hypothetical protein [Clostridia bacterium]
MGNTNNCPNKDPEGKHCEKCVTRVNQDYVTSLVEGFSYEEEKEVVTEKITRLGTDKGKEYSLDDMAGI